MDQPNLQQVEHLSEATNLRHFVEAARQEIKKDPRLGDILVAARFVSREEVEKTVELQGKGGSRKIGELLVERGLISEEQLLTALSIKFRMTFVDLEKITPHPDALKLLTKETVNQLQVFPFDFSGRKLVVATSQPSDGTILDRLCFSANRTVELVAARASHICAAIKKHYNQSDDIVDALISELREEQITVVEEPVETNFVEPDSKVIRLVNRILIGAHELGASDIHFEPGPRHAPLMLRYRVDGECFQAHQIPHMYKGAIISRLKIIANLDIAERRKPQSGKIVLQTAHAALEYRLEITPTVGRQEDAVLRVLSTSKPLPLENMAFSGRNLDTFTKMLTRPYGIILCVGPTGSGKTTTLHSALAHINSPGRKIWTAEDPVEIVQEGLRQVQVNPKIGFTFAEALKSFLRADPDVIMIGEIRDPDTAKTAIAASLSGHLVFSTLHTNSALETVMRLIEMGMEPFYFADALRGILAQRLARKLCESCREEYHPSREEYFELLQHYGAGMAQEHGLPQSHEEVTLMRKKGCEKCSGSGYRGRIALHEMLEASPALKEEIKGKPKLDALRAVALGEGMRTLKMDGIEKVLQGLTDVNQVLKVCIE
ncbi:GspE/PulE family protein [Geomonas sp. RF6]|uniref:GspE/PulE family protein n=1 Tax=Geomonas sp. RF6 TaxID=2897342 RepID=UPI001E37B514|nr:GspE/PulE family protein [Geomonas sp. RF6]UFS70522.1 GspE/PulE family protein [Geomonas sp. RF6]